MSLRLDAAPPAGEHVRIERRAAKTGIAGRLIALRATGVAGCLVTLRPAGLAGRLAALRLTGIARDARCLTTLGLAGIACVAGILVTGVAGILTASRPACITRRLNAIRTAGIVCHARANAGSSKAFRALLSWTAAGLVGNAAEWLARALDSYCDRTIEIGVWNIRLRPSGSCKLHVKVKLILCGGGTGGSRVLDHCIFFDAHPSGLEPRHGALFGRNGLSKNDVVAPKLGVVCEGPVKVEPCPSVAVALSSQPFQYHNIGGRSGGLRA
jgi:hypothetical protein